MQPYNFYKYLNFKFNNKIFFVWETFQEFNNILYM